MYSRSIRKFLQPDHDHANPNLGPGCYTADEATLISGKSLGEDGYAPFASLAPRVSYFDETIVKGPAPGAYDPPVQPIALHNHAKSAVFGKSRDPRFRPIVSNTPGPGSYVIPGTLRKVKKGDGGDAGRAAAADSDQVHRKGMLLEPIVRSIASGGVDGGDLDEDIGVIDGGGQAAGPGAANFEGSGEARIRSGAEGGESNPEQQQTGETGQEQRMSRNGSAVEARSMPLSARKKKTKKSKAGHKDTRPITAATNDSFTRKKPPTIIWRRKYVPPSIPVGESAFGYQENDAKHENHGFRFAREPRGLKFKVTDSPGPGMYDLIKAEKFFALKDTGNGPAVMTLAPCKRLTDEIVAEAIKKGVPGPGAYDSKLVIHNPRLRGSNVPGFGSTSNHLNPTNYIPPDQIYNPGPGTYYPEYSNLHKPSSIKAQPFGSTTSRFDGTDEARSKSLPAPGSYDLEEIDSLVRRVQKRSQITSFGSRSKAFGSVSERFTYSTTIQKAREPGPGQYEVTYIPPVPPRIPTKERKKRQQQRQREISGNEEGGKPFTAERMDPQPRKPKKREVFNVRNMLESLELDPEKVRIPVFGTQSERFRSEAHELPPPGAYEIATAFETLKTKGRVDQRSFLASQMPRELFKIQSNLPGPGEYNILTDPSKTEPPSAPHGGFLSSMRRFDEKTEEIPGPGSYLSPESNSGLIKKSYNITLGRWEKHAHDMSIPSY
ncbi:Sperm-tail PG-rich repeat-containing protein 2 [Blyttiomyces sp. JEL0837]|nr:Sperm-tail PG-rich repeat-containing protein 2 [Blyttiomyces sp. JEL0837]